MKLDDELAAFYKRSGFGEATSVRSKTVPVYTGCLLVPLPNIEARRRFLKYHDLYHLVTGYSVGRIGEGEVSAWELGSGSALTSPTLGVVNLIALSTGLVLEPRRMWLAFRRGCASRNLYPATTRSEIDSGRWVDVAALREHCLLVRASGGPVLLRCAEFALYGAVAMLIHAAIAFRPSSSGWSLTSAWATASFRLSGHAGAPICIDDERLRRERGPVMAVDVPRH